MANAREQYIASQAPRVRRTHPARSAQALKTSGAGIVHRNMMDLQRQPNLSGADIDRLKGLRRDWNRNRKYTDAGMAIAGATTPQDAMKYYSDTTEDFRQLNKPAYGQMYPLTAGIMNIGEKGGILGAILSEIGKMGKDEGLPTMIDDTKADKAKYITETFGPHRDDIIEGPGKSEVIYSPHADTYYDRAEGLDFDVDPNQPYVAPDDYVETDFGDFYTNEDTLAGPRFDDSAREQAIMNQYTGRRGVPTSGKPNMYDVAGPWFGTAPVEDVEISDLPKGPLRVQDYDDTALEDITVTDTMPSLFDKWWKPWLGRKEETEEIPGYATSYIDMIDPETGEPWGEPWMDDQEKFEDYMERGEEPPAITPFNDAGREAGIASMYGQGPQWGSTNRRYEGEYRDHISRTGDRISYEEFERAYERMYQGKPHKGEIYQSAYGNR